ncbi:hypothetical protein R84B8_01783 [Treponema sp. R8-4-B8]
MNKDSFLRYIENDRDCEQNRLDIAVNRGLEKAKNDRFDSKKLFMLAAASVFTFAICIIVNLMPISTVVEGYYESRQKIMPGSSQILNGYVKDIVNNLKKNLGGE